MIPTSPRSAADTGTVVPEAPGPFVVPSWSLPEGELDVSGPVVMGILNLTPDSFSDGGELVTVESALKRAGDLVAEGAAILDVGGESTRPGASPVPVKEELRRILPFLEAARDALTVPFSVDTRNGPVARAAVRAGARIVNDVSGLRHDPGMARVVADEGAALVLSHMRGTPATMRQETSYEEVVKDVTQELGESLDLALSAGVPAEKIVVDPGIGFAKTARQSATLVRELDTLLSLGRPVLLGPSRKSFIGEVTGVPPGERLAGTLAACVLGYARGARIFRVHDVAPTVQALAVARAIVDAQ